jgi:hypothetical protein
MMSAKPGKIRKTLTRIHLTPFLKANICGLVCQVQPLCVHRIFNVIAERSFENEEEEQTEAEGSGRSKEEVKIPEPTLDPDLQTFCRLIFNSE